MDMVKNIFDANNNSDIQRILSPQDIHQIEPFDSSYNSNTQRFFMSLSMLIIDAIHAHVFWTNIELDSFLVRMSAGMQQVEGKCSKDCNAHLP